MHTKNEKEGEASMKNTELANSSCLVPRSVSANQMGGRCWSLCQEPKIYIWWVLPSLSLFLGRSCEQDRESPPLPLSISYLTTTQLTSMVEKNERTHGSVTRKNHYTFSLNRGRVGLEASRASIKIIDGDTTYIRYLMKVGNYK